MACIVNRKLLPVFQSLQQSADLYYSVEVDVGGYGIIWNDELDLLCDELWNNGEVVGKLRFYRD